MYPRNMRCSKRKYRFLQIIILFVAEHFISRRKEAEIRGKCVLEMHFSVV